MCGIVGVAGWVNQRERSVFSNLLGWDVVRGHHATGVAAVKSKSNEIHILKRSMHAYDFMDLKAYDPTIDNSKVLIGHNRFGTVGSNSHRNAHPFVFDNVVGVHNGTIPYGDKKVLKDHEKFDTDSEAIYSNISELGPKEALKNLKGAWSLVWWDRVEHKLNFLRNKERPMYWTFSESKKELYWASESPMLQAVLARHNIKSGPVYCTPEDVMLSFTIPDDYSAIETPERTGVKGASPFVFRAAYPQGGLGMDDWENWGDRGLPYAHRGEAAFPLNGTGEKKSLEDLRLTGPVDSFQLPHSAEKPSEKPKEEVLLGDKNLEMRRKPEAGAMSELVDAVQAQQEQDSSEIPFTPGSGPVTAEPKTNLIHLKDKIKDRPPSSRLVQIYKGFYVNKEEFDKVSKNGCVYCEKKIQFVDILQKNETVHWIKRDAFLCNECMEDSEILEYLAGMNIELPQRKG